MKKLKELLFKKETDEEIEPLEIKYTKVHMTLELRKRKYLEEQAKQYGIEKKKECTIM